MIYKKAYAKINLGLQVVGICDKYHLLNSVFSCIDLYDLIGIENNETDEIVGMEGPIYDNLMFKAINLIRLRYNINKHIKIKIEKNIPISAGLGGGSSDCASVLLLVNQLWNLNLSKQELLELSFSLGSDVAFFIENKACYLNDRGTNYKPIELDEMIGILIFNDAHFNTKDVFDVFDKMKIEYSAHYEEFNGLKLNNDLEKACYYFKDYYKVSDAKKDLLDNKASYSLMSGSGGSVFGIYENSKLLDESYEIIKKKYKKCYKFKTL